MANKDTLRAEADFIRTLVFVSLILFVSCIMMSYTGLLNGLAPMTNPVFWGGLVFAAAFLLSLNKYHSRHKELLVELEKGGSSGADALASLIKTFGPMILKQKLSKDD